MSRSGTRNERLDPVRGRAPTRGTLLRLTVITALLVTAAGLLWLRPTTTPCATPGPSTSPAKAAAGKAATDKAATDKAAAGAHAIGGTTPSPGPAAGQPTPGSPVSSPGSAGKPPVPDGAVGVPVRLADPTALALTHPGDRVDLLRLDNKGRTTEVANAALVLDVSADPLTGGLLLALDRDKAALAADPSGPGFAILLHPS
ncbi:hypothetical protein [Actinoplanes awajinensis]|uniref:Uncharacterized protein n=1 Tax=Actinoplanes awajinensis subsp. mycoplanecinus TaxID=135947 RepID=A0A117MPX6_9ACTN|nr:hypothetical protein [Actinoplanes awajinensis]KUL29350.1 hypothetical protein ADL15_28325 [Actinoplanes awajinensis subsp. mycoplanecinus]